MYYISDQQSSFKLITKEDCICPGDTIVYECSVIGQGSTVYQGHVFDNENSTNEIVLLHSRYNSCNVNVTSNSGVILAQSIRIEDNIFISRLYITYSHELSGRTVSCIYDNGTNVQVIGNLTIPTWTALIGECNLQY